MDFTSRIENKFNNKISKIKIKFAAIKLVFCLVVLFYLEIKFFKIITFR